MIQDRRLAVLEYRPAFCVGFETRTIPIEKPEDAMEAPWLKHGDYLSDDKRNVLRPRKETGPIVVACIMEQVAIRDYDAECCGKWNKGNDQINEGFGYSKGSLTVGPFRFCPWCGKERPIIDWKTA